MITDPQLRALIGLDDPADGASAVSSVPLAKVSASAGGTSVGGAYENATRYNQELAMWSPQLLPADGDILPEKALADARTRDVIRNDSTVGAGADLHRDNIIGSMYLLNSRPVIEVLGKGFDETWEEEFQEEVENLFTLWAESPENWVDASAHNTLTSLLRLAVGVYLAAGEVLASVEWIRDGREFNTAIQMIDLDRLSNADGEPDSPFLRGGVMRNKYGAPIGYHIRMAHPSDFSNPDNWRWKKVPAKKPWGRPQMLHVFEQQRPEQSRGISDLVSALKEIQYMRRFRDVVLQNAIVNATFAASIESEIPNATFAAFTDSNPAEVFTRFGTEYLGAVNAFAGGANAIRLDGAKVPHLFPGTKLQLRPAGPGGPLGTEFETSCLRYIATALGISYEELSRDYTKTNYSSAKAAMLNTWKRMQARKRMVTDRIATTVYSLWLEEGINKNLISTFPRKKANILYTNGVLNTAFRALTACDWIGASRGQIDELKETQAASLRLKTNTSTLEDELARQGKDYRKVIRQIKRERDLLKANGIPLPEEVKDNGLNAASGTPREDNNEDTDTNDQPEERRDVEQ